MTKNFVFQPDAANKTIQLSIEFSAPIEKVWRAFTEVELLEKWLAPKPMTVCFKIMDFRVGGMWLYSMGMPGEHKGWARADFTAIEPGRLIISTNLFTDEHGNAPEGAPKSRTETRFSTTADNGTKVEVVKIFTKEETVTLFDQNGFKEGTLMGYQQLDELLASE
jgi:uncharacterized protein YndB with AHSA1/START domain